jgi:hypothetical protein
VAPPILFGHCHVRGCHVELEEQRLGLLDNFAAVGIADAGFIFFILLPGYIPSGLSFWARYSGE